MTVDAGAGGLATDHRWVPQLKHWGLIGSERIQRVALHVQASLIFDILSNNMTGAYSVRSAYNAVMEWCGGGVSWNKPEEEKDTTRV